MVHTAPQEQALAVLDAFRVQVLHTFAAGGRDAAAVLAKAGASALATPGTLRAWLKRTAPAAGGAGAPPNRSPCTAP